MDAHNQLKTGIGQYYDLFGVKASLSLGLGGSSGSFRELLLSTERKDANASNKSAHRFPRCTPTLLLPRLDKFFVVLVPFDAVSILLSIKSELHASGDNP